MNDSQRATEKSPPANGELVDWYYRLGERERGPMSLSQLTDLVAASGEMAREIVVKHHANGAWVPYETVDPETARRLHSDRVTAAAAVGAGVRVQNDSPQASIAKGGSARVKSRRTLR